MNQKFGNSSAGYSGSRIFLRLQTWYQLDWNELKALLGLGDQLLRWSLTWLLAKASVLLWLRAGKFSSLPCGPLLRGLGHTHKVAAGFPPEKVMKRERARWRMKYLLSPSLKVTYHHFYLTLFVRSKSLSVAPTQGKYRENSTNFYGYIVKIPNIQRHKSHPTLKPFLILCLIQMV